MGGFFFANLAGLWGLLAAAAVVGAYFFHRRYREKRVSALFLWGDPRKSAEGGRHFELPTLSRSFYCDVLCAILLGLALAYPSWRIGSERPLVVILDDSFVMNSRDNRVQTIRFAQSAIDEALRKGRPSALILAGERARIVASFGDPYPDFVSQMAEWHPASEKADFPAALVLAGETAASPVEVLVITNSMQTFAPLRGQRLFIRRLNGRGGNAAFVSLWRVKDEDDRKETLFVDAINYAEQPVKTRFSLYSKTELPDSFSRGTLDIDAWNDVLRSPNAPRPIYTEDLEIAAGKTVSFEVSLEGKAEDIYAAYLSSNAKESDVIREDSFAWIPPLADRSITYAVSSRIPDGSARFLRAALDATGAKASTTPDLLFTSSTSDRGRLLTVQIPVEMNSENVIALRPPFVIDGADPLCRDVHLGDRYWALPKDYDFETVKADDIQKTLILSGDNPLLWIGRDGRFHWIIVPEWSEIARSSAWPALIANIVTETQNRKEGPEQTLYAIGDLLRFRYPAINDNNLTNALAYLDGRLIPSHGAYRLPVRPGLYTASLEETLVIEGKEEKRDRTWPISVSLVPVGVGDTRELSVRERVETVDDPVEIDGRVGVIDLTWICLIAAFMVFFIRERPSILAR